MAELIQYPSGLRLIVEEIPYVRSVAASIWVGTGSAMETEADNGISHFIEHVMFKGTDRLSAYDIAHAFESKGATVNAFTSKESTCYYYKSIDTDTESCFETLSELFFKSDFKKEELDNERMVVVEEINMEEDSPEDICYDLLAKSLYGDQSIAMPVLGTRENVLRFDKKDILGYMGRQYCAHAIVISMAGNIKLSEADRIVRKYILPFINTGKQLNGAPKPKFSPGVKSYIKDFKQTNLMLGYPSICARDSKCMIQSALNVVLGGCMGSRLFQNIREKKGLAYSVYSSPSRHSGCGALNIALNINASNTVKVLEGVFEEIRSLADKGISQTELAMAKAQLKSTLIFGQENIQAIMMSLGKTLLSSDEIFDIDKKLDEIERITVDDVNEMAKVTFCREPALAYVGSDSGADLAEILKAFC